MTIPVLNEAHSTEREKNQRINLLIKAVATTSVADGSITYAKIQNVSATDKLLGRASAGAGPVEEISCTSAGRALLDDADAASQRTTLGLGSAALLTADTDASLTADSDDNVATQKAVKAYVAANSGAMTGAQILSELLTVDGSGSSLDADLLDGVQGSSYCLTTNVDNTIAGLSVGAVGTYAQLYYGSTSALGAGSTLAGSSLSYSTGAGYSQGSSPGGTWRLMGQKPSVGASSVWLRIS